MDKKYIFIDLDGTLVNTSPGIYYAIDYAYEKMGLEPISDEQKNVYIGPPLMVSFKKYAKVDEEGATKCYHFFREAYSEKGVYMHKLYEGIEFLLKSFCDMGKTVVVATSKPEHFAKMILKHYSLDKYFTAICGASMNESRCTKQEVLEYAMATVGMKNAADGVLIGDTYNDVVGANALGMDCVGILYGFGSKKELETQGAKYIAKTPYDVLKLFD